MYNVMNYTMPIADVIIVEHSPHELFSMPKPIALIVLDGFGHRDEQAHNAISSAITPHLDTLMAQYPHMLISGSGHDVGLPEDQMGNSEVGHMNLGAGRVIYQDLTRIDVSIEEGAFAANPVFQHLFDKVRSHGRTLHIMGLVSDGGVHSQLTHIQAAIEAAAAAGITQVDVHAFLDGRDTPPQSAKAYLQALDDTCKNTGVARIASLCGRFYAMDRDNRWERTAKAYNMIVTGETEYHAPDPLTGLEMAYARGENDEFVHPTRIGTAAALHPQDGIIFMNFRADRARQLCRAFLCADCNTFHRGTMPVLSGFVTLTHYADDIPADVAFKPQTIDNTFADVLSVHGKTQLRIAETEKYAHVTFFFNGGKEAPVNGETRLLIPSPKVKTYDLQPEMSAYELTDSLVEAIEAQRFDAIICNYANADMVGHTGNFEATVKAIEALDQCIGRIVAALKKVGGECLITADHGNAEQMFDDLTQQAHTAHTCELVPLIYMGRSAKFTETSGILADVAPTLLYLMGLPIPSDMTGKVLLTLQ